MSNNYNRNTVRIRSNNSKTVRTVSGQVSNASRVYNYELMLQLYYIARQQEAVAPRQLKLKALLPASGSTAETSHRG